MTKIDIYSLSLAKFNIMATSQDFVAFVCKQISGVGEIRYIKMFEEYLVYVDEKPILLIYDNIVYVKMLSCIADLMQGAEMQSPYNGAKPHYILDINNSDLTISIAKILKAAIPESTPKPKRNRIMIMEEQNTKIEEEQNTEIKELTTLV